MWLGLNAKQQAGRSRKLLLGGGDNPLKEGGHLKFPLVKRSSLSFINVSVFHFRWKKPITEAVMLVLICSCPDVPHSAITGAHADTEPPADWLIQLLGEEPVQSNN